MTGGQHGDSMYHDHETVVNWRRFNVPQIVTTLIAVGATGVGIVVYIGNMKAELALHEAVLEQIKTDRANTSQAVNARFTDIQSQLSLLSNIPYRMTTAEASIIAANKRIDDLSTNVIGAMESLRSSVGDLKTKVEVQSNKIDTLSKKVDELSPHASKTDFTYSGIPGNN